MAVQLRYSWLLIMLCLVNKEDRLSCYGVSAFSVSLFRVFSRLYCRTESPLFIFFLCFRGNAVIVVLAMVQAVFCSEAFCTVSVCLLPLYCCHGAYERLPAPGGRRSG